MSVLSRWRGRLKVRQGLLKAARKAFNARKAPSTLKRLRERQEQVAYAERIIARHKDDDSGAAQAVKWALAQVGTTEHPKDSNWGHPVQDWIKASGYGGPVPYCQCGVNAAAVRGGAPQLHTGYTPTVLHGLNGYKRIPVSEATIGCFIYFKWPGVSDDECDHVGMLAESLSETPGAVSCVEFNTSPTAAGSQNNGGGVYPKTRSRAFVVGAVRPPYPS